MKGKTNRQKQLVVTPDMSVRVTQVQQTLSVDIMFVYRMPILGAARAGPSARPQRRPRSCKCGRGIEQIYVDRKRERVRHTVHSSGWGRRNRRTQAGPRACLQSSGGYDWLGHARRRRREDVPDTQETRQMPLPRSSVHNGEDDAQEEHNFLRARSKSSGVEHVCG